MSLVVEDGTGLSTATSYATVDEADSYHADRLHASTWTDAPAATKEAALVSATRVLDHMTYAGLPYTTTQALQWPRCDVYDRNGNAVAVTAVPASLKSAAAELARLLIDDDREVASERPEQSVSLGDASVVYANGGATRVVVPAHVVDMLRPFLAPRRAFRG